MSRKRLMLLAGSALLISCQHEPPVAAPTYSQMDSLQAELATRAGSVMGSSGDFKIIVTQAAYPIGTLMRQSTTIPIDYDSCEPAQAPPRADTPALFPTYSLSRNLALDFGLDKAAVAKVAEFGVIVKDSDSVTLSVKDAQIQALSDRGLLTAMKQAKCSEALSDQSVWLIRGYIRGKRTFTLKSVADNSAKANIEGIGGFKVDLGSGGASLDISDTADIGFLQVISEVSKPPLRTEAKVQEPTTISNSGQIYIQRDKADASQQPELAAAALLSGGFNVARGIERIESKNMPKSPQVRYFNKSDKVSAQRIADVLRSSYPAIALSAVGLPAPQGQIEVWLTTTP